jgi:hypothetical protein
LENAIVQASTDTVIFFWTLEGEVHQTSHQSDSLTLDKETEQSKKEKET